MPTQNSILPLLSTSWRSSWNQELSTCKKISSTSKLIWLRTEKPTTKSLLNAMESTSITWKIRLNSNAQSWYSKNASNWSTTSNSKKEALSKWIRPAEASNNWRKPSLARTTPLPHYHCFINSRTRPQPKQGRLHWASYWIVKRLQRLSCQCSRQTNRTRKQRTRSLGKKGNLPKQWIQHLCLKKSWMRGRSQSHRRKDQSRN